MFRFNIPLYIQFHKNRIVAMRLDTLQKVSQVADEPYTGVRVLIGDFFATEKCLKSLLTQFKFRKWFRPQLNCVIQAMEMTEGGLSNTEKRAMKEVTERCGGRKVVIYEGEHELSAKNAIDFLYQ